ncbi:MAG: hypothetical protein ACXACU_18370, partial [Candidatus Hodarchaeales archaeon]
LRDAEKSKDNEKIELINNYFKELGIKPKKFKKNYESLVKQRKVLLEERIDIEPEIIPVHETVIEPELPLEPEPQAPLEPVIDRTSEADIKVVDTSTIVPIPDSAPIVEPSPEILEEKSDEEVVNVIKRFEQDQDLIIPSLEEIQPKEDLPSDSVGAPIVPDITVESEPESVSEKLHEKDSFSESEILEIPIKDETERSQKTALSDDEIASLFSLKKESLVEPKTVEDEFDTTKKAEVSEKGVSLSSDEIDSLFLADSKFSEPQSEIEEEIPEEEEWEVDGFGRLWKKGTVPSSAEEEGQIEAEIPSSDLDETPDLSPLEKLIKEDIVKEKIEPTIETPSLVEEPGKEDSELNVLEKALRDTQIIVSQKHETEVESTEIKGDLFGQDSDQSPSESQVKPPELADLFSDALSELGGISGEKGELSAKKKKK